MQRLLTRQALSYLRFFAKKALATHRPTIIGVAGSVGKSSTRNALEAILKDHFPTTSVGNSETGIPLGILGMKPESYTKRDWLTMLAKTPFNLDFLKGIKYLIAEMGIDDPFPPKNMTYLLTILKPEIAIVLNESATHSMQFDKALSKERRAESKEQQLTYVVQKIAQEDCKIITESGCKVGIINGDDENIVTVVKEKQKTLQAKILTFGTKNTNAISYDNYKVGLQGSTFHFFLRQEDKHDEFTITFPRHILPKEYREVFAAAILASLQAGLTLPQIKASLEKNYEPPKGRSSLFAGINDSIIIDSSYNASKASATAFLDLVDTLKKETNRNVVFLLGDMRELGQEARIEHEAVAQKLLGIVDYLYLVGPLTRQYILPVVQQQETRLLEIRWFDTALRAGEYLENNVPKQSIVLVKGSQNTIFLEEAVKEILRDKTDSNKLCRQDEYWEKVKATSAKR